MISIRDADILDGWWPSQPRGLHARCYAAVEATLLRAYTRGLRAEVTAHIEWIIREELREWPSIPAPEVHFDAVSACGSRYEARLLLLTTNPQTAAHFEKAGFSVVEDNASKDLNPTNPSPLGRFFRIGLSITQPPTDPSPSE